MFDTVAATAAEKRERRPGDELVPAADVVMGRGFTVAGHPESVWPWIVQLGKWQAGWYLPRQVERFLPPSRPATREIVRHWQQLGPGDVIPDYGGRHETFTVAAIEPSTTLVYRSRRGRIDAASGNASPSRHDRHRIRGTLVTASQIDQIGTTAFFVAALRAAESARPDRLADDPHAPTLLTAAGITTIPGDVAEFVAIMGDQVAVRTRYLDEALLAATAGGCRQVVLMASGMDSRGYRLPWPEGTELFELDQQPVLAFKQDVLAGVATPCPIRHVSIDLRDDWATALRAAGYRDDRPAAWLVEGLLYALDAAAAEGLLETISRLSAPGSTIAFDHVEMGPALTSALTAVDPGLLDLWQTGPLDPAAWLERLGWEPHIVELAALEREHGRPVHPGYDPAVAGSAHSWLGTGRRPA